MSETSALKFQQAYDEARTSITSSLNSVKDTYEGIQRDLGNEIKASNLEKKELTASLNEANNKIEGLNGVITGLETSLSASKELAATTQKTLEDERAAAKAAAEAASKAAADHATYQTQVAAAEKEHSSALAAIKQDLAVQRTTLEQTQTALAEERSKSRDAAHSSSTSLADIDRKLEATRSALEAQKDICADLQNQLTTAKTQMEASAKETATKREELNNKNTALISELNAVKAQAAEWQREADKAKMDAEKSRSQSEAATAEKHAAQEARVLAEKDMKAALEEKAKVDALCISKERDAKDEATKASQATAEAEKANKNLEMVRDKLEGLTTQHHELSDTTKSQLAAASSKMAWLEATLAEKEAAIATMKVQGADLKKTLSEKIAEETTTHEATKSQLERLKQEAYNLYTAYTGAMQQLEEYRVALERESQESARLHQAMAQQKQEAARDALRTNKSSGMLLPPAHMSRMHTFGGGGFGFSGGSPIGNFEQFSHSPMGMNFPAASNISEINPDMMNGSQDGGGPGDGLMNHNGGDNSEKSFTVD